MVRPLVLAFRDDQCRPPQFYTPSWEGYPGQLRLPNVSLVSDVLRLVCLFSVGCGRNGYNNYKLSGNLESRRFGVAPIGLFLSQEQRSPLSASSSSLRTCDSILRRQGGVVTCYAASGGGGYVLCARAALYVLRPGIFTNALDLPSVTSNDTRNACSQVLLLCTAQVRLPFST